MRLMDVTFRKHLLKIKTNEINSFIFEKNYLLMNWELNFKNWIENNFYNLIYLHDLLIYDETELVFIILVSLEETHFFKPVSLKL